MLILNIGMALHHLNVYCIEAFTAFFYFVGHLVTLADVVDEVVGVDENVFTTVVWSNEAKTFGVVEEFNCSLGHVTGIEG